MRSRSPASLVESSRRSTGRRAVRRALAALVVVSFASAAVAGTRDPIGRQLRGVDPIFLDNFETGDPYRWSSFEPSATLTLTNYLSWCTFAIDDGAPSGAASLTRAFLPNDVVVLTGAPQPGFVWGYWTGTDPDNGSGDPSMQTSVTMSADKSVLECCPVMSGMTCN